MVQFEPAGALIDIGAKSTAFMPTREVGSLQKVEYRLPLLMLKPPVDVFGLAMSVKLSLLQDVSSHSVFTCGECAGDHI